MRLLDDTTLHIAPNSVFESNGVEYGLVLSPSGNKLAIIIEAGTIAINGFNGEISENGKRTLLIAPLTPHNANCLRNQIEWLKPMILGLKTSIGMGDRLGNATPGHVKAIKNAHGKVIPIFAQQSIREMTRTKRNPQQVIDNAMWGVFEENWKEGFGADADHLKTTMDIDACLDSGFTFFTFDPGGAVTNINQNYRLNTLGELIEKLPENIQIRKNGLLGKTFVFDEFTIHIDEASLLKAMLKYGNAILQVVGMAEHLQQAARGRGYEIEISMDETEEPTTPIEHVYIVSELRRLGVQWVSFAPRFMGRFEKGVDYIGNINEFEQDARVHAAIARALGPYKLSLHSGSDKFSIYPAFMAQTHGLAHLKTAGTSYLEGLRTIAQINPLFFREIYEYTKLHFESDKQSYLTSADLSKAPDVSRISDWTGLLDHFDAREILHITYGSILTGVNNEGELLFYNRLMNLLNENRDLYFKNLESHFIRHLAPFTT